MHAEGEPAEDRFRRLFDAHFDAVHAYARRRCVRAEDAEDVVSETFTVAWRRLRDIPDSGELPWLYGVARRVLANQRRGARRWLRLLDRVRQQPPDVPTGTLPAASPVLEAMRRLKPAEQEVLRLAAWEGLSHAEIAAALGISPNAATIRMHRARKRLSGLMTEANLAPRKGSEPAGQSPR